MFKVSNDLESRLAAQAEAEFVLRLTEHLCERRPEFLPRFPAELRPRIVKNMVDRACRVGATWESSIAQLVEMMEVFAPNLLDDPRISKLIAPGAPEVEKLGHDPVDRRIAHFRKLMDEGDWQRVIAARSELPLYISPDLDGAPLPDRLAAALPLVLWDHVSEQQAPALAAEAIDRAEREGFAAHEDAGLAVAGWMTLYKPGEHQSWENDIRDPSRPASERLEMLRYRIMIDHGRRI